MMNDIEEQLAQDLRTILLKMMDTDKYSVKITFGNGEIKYLTLSNTPKSWFWLKKLLTNLIDEYIEDTHGSDEWEKIFTRVVSNVEFEKSIYTYLLI